MEHKNIDPHEAINYLYTHGQKYAQAKANQTYLEEFRKTKKSILMKSAMLNGCKSIAAAEMEAYADVEYVVVLEGIKAAVEVTVGLYWGLMAAQARIDVYRSMEASNRRMDRATT